MFNNIPKEITLVERRNPTILMKAIKQVELQHTIKAHERWYCSYEVYLLVKTTGKQGTSEQEDELSRHLRNL